MVSEVDFVGKVGLELELKELTVWAKSHKRVESLIRGGVRRLKPQPGLVGGREFCLRMWVVQEAVLFHCCRRTCLCTPTGCTQPISILSEAL